MNDRGTVIQSEQSSADSIGSNGTYKVNPSYKWLILVAGSMFLLLIVGLLIGASIRHENLSSRLKALGFVELGAAIAAMVCVARFSKLTLQISDDGVFIRDGNQNETSGIHWFELGRVSERRGMGQLALWDKAGIRRVLVDQQFEKFGLIRSRILDEYAKVFTLKPLPIEFRNPHPLNPTSLIMASAAAFFIWAAWSANRANARVPAILLAFCAILCLISFLSLFPQLRGPSVLFENRIVLRSLFKTREFYKKDVTSIELKNLANSSGTKFSLINLQAIGGKKAKITFIYGSIPELYLTLRAWLAQ